MCHKVLDTVLLQEFEKEEKATSRELIIAKRSERRDDLVGVRLGADIGIRLQREAWPGLV
jgi:hypothetical protein